MTFLAGYIAFLILFGVCDAIWLGLTGRKLYRPALGDLLLQRIRWVPALIFYFGFPLGVVHFAVMPALAAGSWAQALGNGALLGLMAYGTYDLTNLATLRPWKLSITLADMAYGTAVTGVGAAIAVAAVRMLAGWGWL
jgi:uncharacterized membrane protein